MHTLNARFAVIWLIIFISFMAAFYGLGLVPRNIDALGKTMTNLMNKGEPSAAAPAVTNRRVIPKSPTAKDAKIIIPEIGVNAPIILPKSTNSDVLNSALTKGVVHYPGSALPGESGNIFLFGHSTSLPVVKNKAYTSFNNLSKLKKGDIARVRYGGREYWYKVTSVAEKKDSEALIYFDSPKRMLTLSTCNVLGAKEDRFIVEAEFIRSYPLHEFASAAGSSS